MTQDRSISMLAANAGALALVGPPVLGLAAVFVGLWGGWALMAPVVDVSLLAILGVIAVGTLAHELLHALAWWLAARPPKGTIRLGFQWKTVTPYAHCSVPMTARAYRIGAVTPGIVLGLLPALVGIATGWGDWALFGLLFTLAAGGDAVIVWVLRGVPGDALVDDHPSRAGCLVLDPDGEAVDAVGTAGDEAVAV